MKTVPLKIVATFIYCRVLSPFAARLRYEFWEPTGGPLDRVELARLAEELLVFVKEQTGLT